MVKSAEPLTPRTTRIKLDLPHGESARATKHDDGEPVVIRDTPPLGRRTEFWNTLTHGAAAALAVAGAIGIVVLLARHGSPLSHKAAWAAGLFYAGGLIYLYAASFLSHYFSWRFDRVRRGYWRRQDQVGILAVAVSSLAPLALHSEGIGRVVLPLMALGGFVLLIALLQHHRRTLNPVYLAQLGWLPPLATFDILRISGGVGFAYAMGGCVCYLGGLYFLLNDGRRWWFHPVWHLTAVAGSTLHYVFLTTWCL